MRRIHENACSYLAIGLHHIQNSIGLLYLSPNTYHCRHIGVSSLLHLCKLQQVHPLAFPDILDFKLSVTDAGFLRFKRHKETPTRPLMSSHGGDTRTNFDHSNLFFLKATFSSSSSSREHCSAPDWRAMFTVQHRSASRITGFNKFAKLGKQICNCHTKQCQ